MRVVVCGAGITGCSRAHVDHIELSDGRATGVIIVDTNGPRRIDADLVIVALGTM